jgi:hypothetical protein
MNTFFPVVDNQVVIVEKLLMPSPKAAKSCETVIRQDLMVIDEPEHEPVYDWMHLIKMFLENLPPSDDNSEVEHIAHKSKYYHIIDDILLRRGTNRMMMKCIPREEDIQLLRDIHSGIYRSHSSWRTIINKAFTHGFY